VGILLYVLLLVQVYWEPNGTPSERLSISASAPHDLPIAAQVSLVPVSRPRGGLGFKEVGPRSQKACN
jgi:hypothetical protein